MRDPPVIGDIEAGFERRRCAPPNLSGAFATSFACVAPESAGALRQGAVALAEAADAWPGPELPYHNRHHFAEATLAMGLLCRLACEQGLLSREHAALGVVAMVGHDLHHDGSLSTGGLNEARSWAAMAPLLAAAGVEETGQDLMRDVVLGTDPARVAANAAALATDASPRVLLRVLANEADICGSMLPALGPRLGQLLAAEWRAAGGEALVRMVSYGGRSGFLRGYPPFSAPAHALGLSAARERSLAALAEAGVALAGESSPEAGGAALDGLGSAAAAAAYGEALARVISRSA